MRGRFGRCVMGCGRCGGGMFDGLEMMMLFVCVVCGGYDFVGLYW